MISVKNQQRKNQKGGSGKISQIWVKASASMVETLELRHLFKVVLTQVKENKPVIFCMNQSFYVGCFQKVYSSGWDCLRLRQIPKELAGGSWVPALPQGGAGWSGSTLTKVPGSLYMLNECHLQDIEVGQDFLDKASKTFKKSDNLNYMTLRSFCTAKINKVEKHRQNGRNTICLTRS